MAITANITLDTIPVQIRMNGEIRICPHSEMRYAADLIHLAEQITNGFHLSRICGRQIITAIRW